MASFFVWFRIYLQVIHAADRETDLLIEDSFQQAARCDDIYFRRFFLKIPEYIQRFGYFLYLINKKQAALFLLVAFIF